MRFKNDSERKIREKKNQTNKPKCLNDDVKEECQNRINNMETFRSDQSFSFISSLSQHKCVAVVVVEGLRRFMYTHLSPSDVTHIDFACVCNP